ncbi:Ig-like domain-containing protein, partial [Marinoscillum furvescens]|uniref:Ig-like domain-containing protein n=1 Tax=Marinoscillum furvescens TaxID=1026 RepID=UPI0011C064A6
TSTPSPSLSGTVDDFQASISVTVAGVSYTATNDGAGSWSLAAGELAPLAEGVYDVAVTATDSAGNVGVDGSVDELTIDLTAPVLTLADVLTNNPLPTVSGTVDDSLATVTLKVNGQTVSAVVSGTSWTVASGTLDSLSEGVYSVEAIATDAVSNADTVVASLTVDTTAPVVAVSTLSTSETSPALSGSVDDASASVSVTVNGSSYTATNDGAGSWSLAAGQLTGLTDGVYDVAVTATDEAGNAGTDATTDELTIDTTAPEVTINDLETLEDSPELTGTVDDETAIVTVTVNGNTYTASVSGSTWTLATGTIASLAVDTYTMSVTATDEVGNSSSSSATLTIMPGAPRALAASDVEYFSFTANWAPRTGVTSYRLDVAEDEFFINMLPGLSNKETTETSEAVAGVYYGQTYYYRLRAVYASGDESPNSNVIAVTTPKDPKTAEDSLALLSIYAATGGDQWTGDINWTEGLPLRDWNDVTMIGTRVTSVDLAGKNLTGSFPAITTGLDALTTLDLSGNDLTDIADLTNLTALSTLSVSDNHLAFGSIEANQSIAGFSYTPQDSVSTYLETLEQQGTNYTIDRTVSGSANSYTWYKQDLIDGSITELTNSGSTLTVAIESFDDEGAYYAEVTSSVVTDLTLITFPVVLKVSSLERDFAALQNIYDKMGGSNWPSPYNNWPNEASFDDWAGVTIENERVTKVELPEINMTGVLPNDILDIAGLEVLDLSGNRISTIPDFSSLANLTSVDVSGNNLEFDDLEKNMDLEATIAYADQRRIGVIERDTVYVGSEVLLSVQAGGSANTYTWLLTNDLGEKVPVAGQTGPDLLLDGIGYETMGDYRVEVTNSLVPDLTLTTRLKQVMAVSNLKFLALDLFGDAFTAAEGYALRVTAPGNPYDTIQTIRGGDKEAGFFRFDSLILGDYLIAVAPDDLDEFLPTYYPSTDVWTQAREYILRSDGTDTLFMAQIPPPLPPLPDGGVVGGSIESDFQDKASTEDSLDNTGGRIHARRKVKRAGCSMRRFVRRGRTFAQDSIFELYAYVQSDDEGRFEFTDIEPGLYRFNIEYPGIPMDSSSFVQFEIGADGVEKNSFTLEATVTEEGIKVDKIEELGFYRHYFKDLTMYPNPADEYVTLRYAKLWAETVKVRIVSLEGRVMLEEDMQRGYNQELTLDVSDLNQGVYLLNFIDTEKSGSKTIV